MPAGDFPEVVTFKFILKAKKELARKEGYGKYRDRAFQGKRIFVSEIKKLHIYSDKNYIIECKKIMRNGNIKQDRKYKISHHPSSG